MPLDEDLLHQFLKEDAHDASTRQFLLKAIRDGKASQVRILQEFDFNRFNIHFNFKTRQVLIEDDLSMDPENDSCRLDMAEFERVLGQS